MAYQRPAPAPPPRVPLQELGVALHDLCQPLTTLQCRLEMARIIDTDAEYRDAVGFSLAECQRLACSVAHMRELLRASGPDLAEETGIRRY